MNPRKILIVGGASAGWLTAAHLHSVLNRDGRELVNISVLESLETPVSGVGESTLPNINRILAILGVDQQEFMRRVDGTFKQGSKFVNWLHNEGEYFYHPFSMPRSGVVDRSGQRWLKSNRSVPFAETVSAQPMLCEQDLSPRMLSRWDFGPPLTYAFHVDELKFANYLRELLTDRVTQHTGQIAAVEMAGNGDIAAVNSSNGERLEADLFIDCTGSAALLSGKELDVAWVDCSEWLLCDRALSIRVPYEQHYPGYVHPYTTATALSAGWAWDIPLQDSRSLGYVYSSAFLSEEAADRELRFLEGSHADSVTSTETRFKTGHRENAWVRNCISIGAASASIDPLESTGLHMIDVAATMLVEHFPYGEEMGPLAYRYNRIMKNRFYEILDFVNLHYCLTRRTDTDFWREVQRPERINERLQAKLSFWRVKQPTPMDFEDQFFPGQSDTPLPSSKVAGDYRSPVDTASLWDHENYEVVLYGMDFLNEECDDWFGEQRPNPGVPRHIVERLRLAPQKLPPHAIWLQQVCGMPNYPTSERVTQQ